MLEGTLEKKCTRWWRKQYGSALKLPRKLRPKSRKMNGLGFRGWPDRMYPLPNRRVWWVEFKKPGHRDELTPLQAFLHECLASWGQHVEVIDDFEQFQSSFRRAYAEALDSAGASQARR